MKHEITKKTVVNLVHKRITIRIIKITLPYVLLLFAMGGNGTGGSLLGMLLNGIYHAFTYQNRIPAILLTSLWAAVFFINVFLYYKSRREIMDGKFELYKTTIIYGQVEKDTTGIGEESGKYRKVLCFENLCETYTVTDRREGTTFQNGVSVYVVRFNAKILGVYHVDDTSVACTTPAASNWTDGKIKGEFIR